MSDSEGQPRASGRRHNGGQRPDDEESLLVTVDDDDHDVGHDGLRRPAAANNVGASNSTSNSTTPSGWKFERLTTLPTATILIILNLIMIGLVFLIPGICDPSSDPKKSCLVDPLSSLIYAHAIHWTFHLVADQYLKSKHKTSRCRGYIEFYLDTKNLRRTPFYMVSIGNAVLLLTVTALHDYCDHETNNCPDKFTKVDYLRGLITLECMTIACIWVRYILNVRDFHRKAHRPDIYREEFVQLVCPENAMRLTNDTEPSAKDVLEKQAELIRCMHEYVTRLNEKMSAALCNAAAGHNQPNPHHHHI